MANDFLQGMSKLLSPSVASGPSQGRDLLKDIDQGIVQTGANEFEGLAAKKAGSVDPYEEKGVMDTLKGFFAQPEKEQPLSPEAYSVASDAEQRASNVISEQRNSEGNAAKLALTSDLLGTGISTVANLSAIKDAERAATDAIDFKSGLADRRFNRAMKETENSLRLAKEGQEINNIQKMLSQFHEGDAQQQLADSGSQRQQFN